MMPIASLSAYVVGPTKPKPRFFSALLSAIDSGLDRLDQRGLDKLDQRVST